MRVEFEIASIPVSLKTNQCDTGKSRLSPFSPHCQRCKQAAPVKRTKGKCATTILLSQSQEPKPPRQHCYDACTTLPCAFIAFSLFPFCTLYSACSEISVPLTCSVKLQTDKNTNLNQSSTDTRAVAASAGQPEKGAWKNNSSSSVYMSSQLDSA